ncbi:MAG: beta-N-acetylhexosaminidase [Verrucomicrobiales bacterium]|jgi:beta-N-acetylhexosaminidase
MRRDPTFRTAVLTALAIIATACSSTGAVESTSLEQGSSNPPPTIVAAAETSPPAPLTSKTPETTTLPPTTTTPPTAAECAAEVPLELRVGQLMFPVMVQSDFAVSQDLAGRGLLGGVVVLGSPTRSIAADIDAYQKTSLLGPGIVAVDEEGGRVQRLASLTSALPSARRVASTLTLAEAEALAKDHAVAIGELGFTMNLAPVIDLDNGGFIGDRSFGDDPAAVTDFGFATADGILAGGLTPVMKHFPGHGRGTDSHTGLPTLPDLETLRESDLVPFIRAIERGDLPIMVGHLVVPGLTNGQPATLSPEAIDGFLRTELGFDGLVMTDAFNMDAISATTSNAEAAVIALGAGVDLVMLGSVNEVEQTVATVVESVLTGRIEEASITESFLRVLDARDLTICALPEDLRPALGCEAGPTSCG